MINNTKTVTVKYVVGKVASGKTTELINILIDESKSGGKNIFVSNEMSVETIIKKLTMQCMLKDVYYKPMGIEILSYMDNLIKNIKSNSDYLKGVKNIFIDGSFSIQKKDWVYLMQNFNGIIYMDYQLPRYCK